MQFGIAVSLTACGGGGGSPGVVGSAPVDPVDPPSPPEGRGPLTLPEIDQVPLSAVKLTNEQMQQRFAVVDSGGTAHEDDTRETACKAYITGCADSNDFPVKRRVKTRR